MVADGMVQYSGAAVDTASLKLDSRRWKNPVWYGYEESGFLRRADGGGRIWCGGIFSWHTSGPFIPIKHSLNATSTGC